MFRGLTAMTVDEKGRIAIPARYRPLLDEQSGGQLVLTISTMDPCLLLYTLPEWEAIEAKLSELSSFNPMTRRVQRLLIGHATELQMDRSKRILLPPLLRGHAHIDTHMMLVGQGNKFELWSQANWDEASKQWLDADDSSPDDLPAELAGLSL